MPDNAYPKDDKARNAIINVRNKANKSIIENERIVDTQSIVISIGLLTIIFASFEFVYTIKESVVICMYILLLITSTITLALSIYTPTLFVHKRRAIKDDLRKLTEKENYTYTEEEILAIEQKHLRSKDIKYFPKVHWIEAIRFYLALLSIILFLALALLIFTIYNSDNIWQTMTQHQINQNAS